MHRLFVAIRPPEEIRNQLLDLMEGVPDARWQDDEQLHLTLRFIGEVDRHMASDIAAALGSIRHPRFELALSGLGTFNRRGQPVTLWAGVNPHDPLISLHKKIDLACLRGGLEPEHRAYTPHITIARLGRSAAEVQRLLQGSGALSSAPFPVRDFRLCESDLSPQGAIYTVVERYELA